MMDVTKEIEIYYNKEDVVVRDSCPTDIAYLKNDLKRSDVEEIWASHHKLPYDALQEGLANSSQCLTVAHNGRALAMFGIVPTDNPERAVIWFLCSEDLFRITRFEFIRHSAGFVGFMMHRAPQIKVLFNWVDARNKISIRWLTKIGAHISEPIAFGEERLPFHYFEFVKGE